MTEMLQKNFELALTKVKNYEIQWKWMNFVSFHLDHEQNLLHKYRNYLRQDSIKTFYESLPYPVQYFLMFRHLKVEIIFGKLWCHPGCHNTEHNDTQLNDNLQNDILLNNIHL